MPDFFWSEYKDILISVMFVIIMLLSFWIASYEQRISRLRSGSIKAFDEAERRIIEVETAIMLIKASPKKRWK
jgi:hypothetical protein